MIRNIYQKLTIANILIGAFILRLILVLVSNWHPDMGNHVDWGIRFWEYGPKNFYTGQIWSVSVPNQPFGSIYLFAIIKVIKDQIMNLTWYLNNNFPLFPSRLVWIFEQRLQIWLLKLPFVTAEVGIGYLIYRIVNSFKPKLAILASAIFLFNPVTFYNSAVWGQTDSLINLLSLSGLYLVYKKNYLWGIPIFLSSYIFKLSLILYLPIFVIILLKDTRHYRKIIITTLTTFLVFCLLALPFSYPKNPIIWTITNFQNQVISGQGHMLNGNAFNLWYFKYGSDLTKSELQTCLGVFSCRQIGLGIFAVVLLPIFFKFIHQKITLDSIILTCFLTAFLAFVFMTAIHERYLYPVIPLISILLFTKKYRLSWLSYFSISFIHLLNLYNLWFYPDIPILKTILLGSNFLLGKVFSTILIGFAIHFLLKYLQGDQET